MNAQAEKNLRFHLNKHTSVATTDQNDQAKDSTWIHYSYIPEQAHYPIA